MKVLTYGLFSKFPLSLDLYEAETYANAVIVQPLIGNLTRYSNSGRYEPFLAESWEKISDTDWEFRLKDGLTCENGEAISATSFKASIELSLKALSKASPPAILSKLKGYTEFISGGSKDVTGINTREGTMIFSFVEPMNDGVVQILSFAPFGYICQSNRDQKSGAWLDKEKFISSGPYRLVSHVPDIEYVLEKRNGFGGEKAPSKVRIKVSKSDKGNISLPTPAILDNALTSTAQLEGGTRMALVPEYLHYVLLSPEGSLKDAKFRRQFIREFVRLRNESIAKYPEGYAIAKSFYPNEKPHPADENSEVQHTPKTIRILGKEPKTGARAVATWSLIKTVLEKLGWEYSFDSTERSYFESNDPKSYDIRMGSSSIGGAVEAWGLDVLFCSDFGPRLPDPEGHVCRIVDDLKHHKISELELPSRFEQAIFDGAAVIPVTHYGITLYLSPEIDPDSVSPLMSILRFDELSVEVD